MQMSGRRVHNLGLKLGVRSYLSAHFEDVKWADENEAQGAAAHGQRLATLRIRSGQVSIDDTGVRLVSMSPEEYCSPIVVSPQKSHLVYNGPGWYLQMVGFTRSETTLPNFSGMMQSTTILQIGLFVTEDRRILAPRSSPS